MTIIKYQAAQSIFEQLENAEDPIHERELALELASIITSLSEVDSDTLDKLSGTEQLTDLAIGYKGVSDHCITFYDRILPLLESGIEDFKIDIKDSIKKIKDTQAKFEEYQLKHSELMAAEITLREKEKKLNEIEQVRHDLELIKERLAPGKLKELERSLTEKAEQAESAGKIKKECIRNHAGANADILQAIEGSSSNSKGKNSKILRCHEVLGRIESDLKKIDSELSEIILVQDEAIAHIRELNRTS